jgi:NAD(P)-dependent dehydrogenase (short-subunit alcohol dehydrogenase family)
MRKLPAGRPTPFKVYVSASSRGLAFEIARQFARDGADIALSSRIASHLDTARQTLLAESPQARVLTIQGDIANVGDQEKILATLDAEDFQPDAFVCSAGHPMEGRLSSLSRADWGHELEMILGHAVFASQKFASAMADRGFGRFIFLSSLYAKAPNHDFFISSLARSALFALSKMVAGEYADRGMAAFVVCLGYIDTPLLRNRALGRPHDEPDPEESLLETWSARYEEWAADIPAKRIATPAELARFISFLTLPEAEYLNGNVFSFSGGMDKEII